MLGLVNRSLVEFVGEFHGEAGVAQLHRELPELPSRFEALVDYPIHQTAGLISFVARLRDVEHSTILDDLGTYSVIRLWDARLRDCLLSCGKDFNDFLRNLPIVIGSISRIEPRIRVGDLQIEEKAASRFLVHVADQMGLLGDVLQGVLRTIADEFGALTLIERSSKKGAVRISINVFDPGHSSRFTKFPSKACFENYVRAEILQIIFEASRSAVLRLDDERASAEHAALTDNLTGLLNRRGLSHWWRQNQAQTSSLGIAMLDLDKFKPINDRYGHAVGDAVLKAIAGRLKSLFRASDAVSRVGGDEFAVLYPTSSEAAAEKTAKRVLKLFDDPISIDGATYHVGGSLGLVVRSGDQPSSLNILLQVADVGLYEAKSKGRGTYRLRQLADQQGPE